MDGRCTQPLPARLNGPGQGPAPTHLETIRPFENSKHTRSGDLPWSHAFQIRQRFRGRLNSEWDCTQPLLARLNGRDRARPLHIWSRLDSDRFQRLERRLPSTDLETIRPFENSKQHVAATSHGRPRYSFRTGQGQPEHPLFLIYSTRPGPCRDSGNSCRFWLWT